MSTLLPAYECDGRFDNGRIDPRGCRRPAVSGFVAASGTEHRRTWLFCGVEHAHLNAKPIDVLVHELLGHPRRVGDPHPADVARTSITGAIVTIHSVEWRLSRWHRVAHAVSVRYWTRHGRRAKAAEAGPGLWTVWSLIGGHVLRAGQHATAGIPLAREACDTTLRSWIETENGVKFGNC